MATNSTTICNLALSKIGNKRIVSLDEESPEARACRLVYEPARDEVLRSHQWNFAMKRMVLSRLVAAPAFGWACQFQLPVDCLRVLQLNGYEPGERRDNWEIEGRVLLADDETAEIKYIARVTDGNLYDAIFVKALAVKVGAEIAKPLAGSSSLAEGLLTEYERIVGPLARSADSFESRPKRKLPWVESDLVRARSGGR